MKTRFQIVAQQRQLLSFLPHVRAQFGNLPGVELVGLGAKERSGKIFDEWAFRFYVNAKRPLKDIPEDQHIPNRIFGIQTDVISHFEKASLVCETSVLSVDTTNYRDNGIRGGISIRNDHFNNKQPSGYGTLGILARRKSDNALVGLTCSHVVNAASESPTTLSTKIGHPKYWISCCCCPHGYIGDVAKATSTNDLDCAIIAIHDDVLEEITSNSTENLVEGIVGNISGAAAVVCFETLRKRGRATGLTTGKVSEVAYGTNQMLIERTDGNPGDPFACHGDSGAVIVNSGNKVVGLLVAANRADMKKVIATHIKPVMAELGITIAGTDVATIGEPVGGGATGCELNAWPGGNADTALNPVEVFRNTDFQFNGPVDWDVSGGRAGAVIVETGTQTATGLPTISVRYDTVSPSKNPTDAVWVKAKSGTNEVTKFRTIFQFVARTVNTSSLLESSNNLRFAATGGTDNTQCGVAVPGTNGATWFMAKVETVYDIGPQDIGWSSSGGIEFIVGGGPGIGLKGDIVARRETKFTRGEQATGSANRTHTDQTTFIAAAESTTDDFQGPTDAAPNEVFRIANEGFDPTNLLQGYLRADYRDFLEFHDGVNWIRVTPYGEWHADLTATLSGTGTAPPSVGTPNSIDVSAGTEKVPNEKPVVVVQDFQEVKPGEAVTLSVTSSSDPNNDVRSAASWVQTAGPAVALSSTTGNSVTFNAPANDPQLIFSATVKDSTETLSRTAGNFLSDPALATVSVIEWLDRDGGSAIVTDNETEDFTDATFGIGPGPLNWDVTTGGTTALIIEADGAPVGPIGTVNGASTIKVAYDNASTDTTRAQTVKIQATNPANSKIWYKRRTVRLIEWLQRCGGHADVAKNPTEVFTSANMGMAGAVNWDVSTGGADGFIVETGGTTANGRASITVRYDHHSPDATRANAVIIRATDPADATKYNYKRRSVARVTLTLRDSGVVEPSPENEDHANSVWGAGGTDVLGPLPMGSGRSDYPNDAYTAPIQVVAEVVGHLPATVFRWMRMLTRRSWFIQLSTFSTQWNVTQRSVRGPADDTDAGDYNDATPSAALNRMYIYDNSALVLSAAHVPETANVPVGGYVYEEKAFTYKLERQDGAAWITCTEIAVGQIIKARRDDDTGTVTTDWVGLENSHGIRLLSATVTEAEVRAIVGGALPIVIDPNANV